MVKAKRTVLAILLPIATLAIILHISPVVVAGDLPPNAQDMLTADTQDMLASNTPELLAEMSSQTGTEGAEKKKCDPPSPCPPKNFTGVKVGTVTCACGAACADSSRCNFDTGTCTTAIVGTCAAGGAKCNCVCNPD